MAIIVPCLSYNKAAYQIRVDYFYNYLFAFAGMSVVNGVNGLSLNQGLQWKVGLVTWDNKYLTAETFGNEINANGTTFKRKQQWFLEQDQKEEVIYIKSHLGKYLSADKYGNTTCQAEEKGDAEKFSVEYNKDGKWLFKNKAHGFYLQANFKEDKKETIKCFAKSPSKTETWTIQLSIHPQINLKNVCRKRYVHFKDDEIQCNADIPWGADALITLEFSEGKYAFKTCNNRYLHKNGTLEEQLSEDCKFMLEIKSGQQSGLAFKDNEGRYLTGVGSTATMKGRNKTITKDELFTIEDSHPQVIFVAHNGKKASIKQEWHGDGTASIKAANDKYIVPKGTGSMYATSDSVTDKEKFKVKIVNRPLLVLKSDFGFVGVKNPNAEVWEFICNKVTHDVFFLTPSDNGTYTLKGQNQKDVSVSDEKSLVTDGTSATPLILEFHGFSKLSIRAPNNCYFKGEQNGLFLAKQSVEEETISPACFLEY
ncbi:hypothetical protein KUTeg_003608 [Tegillarca granosa]|uniref:Fascin n=1 Tax=Tegillarca granosa TaxID=220873 RepID=A0ABQ9FML2_TEGGR|nr:hypothetical protein KUTeg_003608 [Tegillarca granosa]